MHVADGDDQAGHPLGDGVAEPFLAEPAGHGGGGVAACPGITAGDDSAVLQQLAVVVEQAGGHWSASLASRASALAAAASSETLISATRRAPELVQPGQHRVGSVHRRVRGLADLGLGPGVIAGCPPGQGHGQDAEGADRSEMQAPVTH